MSDNLLRGICTGYIVRYPLGGNAWPYLQYVLGLRQLGHDVYYVEESGSSEYCCYDPHRHCVDANPSYGLRFIKAAFDSVGLGARWAYYDAHADTWYGPAADHIKHRCVTADFLLRMPAIADSLHPWFEPIPVRVLVDIDPVFTQLRHLKDPSAKRDASRYTAYFSFGENIFRGIAEVPDDEFPWMATRPPIVLDQWPVTKGPREGNYTTVMKWESYPAGEYDGVHYGMKAESFQPYVTLPRYADAGFEMAVGGGQTPVKDLTKNGWLIRNPLNITRDLWTYQRYIRASKAEFSVAKHGYVLARTGWLSDRSGAYLASGRPVLVQDTGFAAWLDTGEGLLTYETPAGAVEAVQEINARYEYHCGAARQIAEQYFDSRKILDELLEISFKQTDSRTAKCGTGSNPELGPSASPARTSHQHPGCWYRTREAGPRAASPAARGRG